MARLESQSKLGYYPTPERTLGFILSWLSAPGEGCCGDTWTPAAARARRWPPSRMGTLRAFGIELSDVRASAAEDQLAHVINTGYEYAVLTPETFSLVLLNPPYDGEETTGGGKRLEEVFLCDLPTTDVLIPGGVLIYIIPHKRINERIARHLAGWYRDLRCFRLPAGEYEMFKQIVVLAVKRPTYEVPDGETLKAVLEWRNGSQIARYDDVEEKALPPRFLEQAGSGARSATIHVILKDGQPIATKAADDAARTWMAKAQQLIAEAETGADAQVHDPQDACARHRTPAGVDGRERRVCHPGNAAQGQRRPTFPLPVPGGQRRRLPARSRRSCAPAGCGPRLAAT